MNTLTLGVRNAFRNTVRSTSIIVILGLSIGLALTMLIARQAVNQKINSVKSSVGNTITISPAGFRGFSGNGTALTETELTKVKNLAHVSAISESLTDRLTTSDTNLQASMTAGALGRRFADASGSTSTDAPDPTTGGGFGGTRGTFTPAVQVVGTNNPTTLDASQGGGTLTLTSGTAFTSDSTADVAIVGSSLASKNSLKVGSTFTAYNKTITVVGIYDAGNSLANGLLIMPLATIQTLSSQAGDVTSATVTVDSLSNVSSVTSAIKSALGSSTADVESAQDASETTIASLENIKNISAFSLIGAIIAGAVIILLTMIMIVRERRREIGILKAIGASNSRVIFQFMSEAVTLTLAGAVIGILLGVVGANPITKLLVDTNNSNTTAGQTTSGFGGPGGGRFGGTTTSTSSSPSTDTTASPAGGRGFFGKGAHSLRNNLSNIHANVGWSVLAYGFGAAVLIAIIGSSLAGWMIARIRPYEVMRAE